MTDDLYERYKEALRNGHVAVLRGALHDALAAYRTAAEIAPSRAMPHTSMGGVYMRMGHLEDALTEFAAAVSRAPHDEGALLGQAEALNVAGMHSSAAQALDHVAEIQESAGRLPEAADTLRRALELEDDPDRVRRQRAMLREIRFSAGDRAAEQLLARALRLREEPSDGLRVATGPAASSAPEPASGPIEAAEAEASIPPAAEPETFEPVGQPFAATAREPEPAAYAAEPVAYEPEPVAYEPEPAAYTAESQSAPVAFERELAAAAAPEPAAYEPEPVVAAVPERPAIGVMAGLEEILGPVGPGPDTERAPGGDELLAAAEEADAAGDTTKLRSLLLWTARAYAREGRFEAGLDAAHRLLQRGPNDVDAHLVLIELYLARRWDGLAADKLRLLGKLAELNNDGETRRRLSAVAIRAFPDDSSLASLLS